MGQIEFDFDFLLILKRYFKKVIFSYVFFIRFMCCRFFCYLFVVVVTIPMLKSNVFPQSNKKNKLKKMNMLKFNCGRDTWTKKNEKIIWHKKIPKTRRFLLVEGRRKKKNVYENMRVTLKRRQVRFLLRGNFIKAVFKLRSIKYFNLMPSVAWAHMWLDFKNEKCANFRCLQEGEWKIRMKFKIVPFTYNHPSLTFFCMLLFRLCSIQTIDETAKNSPQSFYFAHLPNRIKGCLILLHPYWFFAIAL